MLLWLWQRPVATAPIGLLAWEPPYAKGAALKRQKDQKEKKKSSVARVPVRESVGALPMKLMEPSFSDNFSHFGKLGLLHYLISLFKFRSLEPIFKNCLFQPPLSSHIGLSAY